jgi:hypothetical protein
VSPVSVAVLADRLEFVEHTGVLRWAEVERVVTSKEACPARS